MSGPIRVVHVVLNLQPGGVQLQLLQVLRHSPAEFESQVISLHRRGTLRPAFRALGCKVRYAAAAAARRAIPAGRLADLLRRRRPDLVHAHDTDAILLTAEAARTAGAGALVAHYHTPMPGAGDGGERHELEARALRRYRRLIFNDKAGRDDLLRRVPTAAAMAWDLVPNGVDLRRFYPPTESERAGGTAGGERRHPVAGMVARIDPVKRHELLIDAAAMLEAQGLPLEVWVVGEGRRQYLEELRERVEARGLRERVFFKGYTSRPEHVYRELDVLVLCSSSEGQPLALLEAWACGVPVVATRVPGLRDMIRDGVDGMLCAADDAEALATAIRRVVGDPGLRMLLRRGGLERAREFTVERSAAKLWETYRRVLGEAPRGRRPWGRLTGRSG